MTEKMKITKRQEKALELLDHGHIRNEPERKMAKYVENYHTFGENEDLYSLKDFSPAEYAFWLCGWYEVEESLQVGDWVIDTRGRISKITDIAEDGFKYTDLQPYEGHYLPHEIKREATYEETAQEKERRKWRKIGRAVGDYHVGDIVWDQNEGEFLEVFGEKHPTEQEIEVRNSEYTGRHVNEKCLRLVAPVEQRLDEEDNS